MRSAPTTRSWPGWWPGPVPAHRRTRSRGGAVRHRDQPAEHRVGAVRQRHAGTDPSRRHLVCVVPQVVDGPGPDARAARAEVLGLMAEPDETRARSPATGDTPAAAPAFGIDYAEDSSATIASDGHAGDLPARLRRRRLGRRHHRRHRRRFDDRTPRVTRNAVADPSARRWAGRDPAGAREGSAHCPDDESRCRRVEAVLLELRPAGRDARRRTARRRARAGARTAAARIRSCRSSGPATRSPVSTRSRAASPTADWAGCIWPSTTTSTSGPSCSRAWFTPATPRRRRSRWPNGSSWPR